ncbi:MAG: DNA-directed RNA polymerase subunit omega [Armatimonadota bacterium]
MIYPHADRLEDQVKSRYTLVVLAAKRAKQLRDGASKLIETTSTNPLTIALEEIAAGKVIPEVASHDEVPARAIEPELEAAAGMETAQEEAAELTAEAPSVVDEAARIAELLKVPGTDEEAAEEESDTDTESASEEEAQPDQAEE